MFGVGGLGMEGVIEKGSIRRFVTNSGLIVIVDGSLCCLPNGAVLDIFSAAHT
jgi:hypothetical protein